jgi:sugar/nucleoside kinase (ribokinase family)
LALSDVFFPNEREACALAGAASVDQAVERLKDKVNTLAVKLGPYGSIGATRGEKRQVPAFPVTVVDTVGAGDSFDAGFIYGFLLGWPLEKNLKVATVCGALSTTAAGGTSAQATLDEVLREIA